MDLISIIVPIYNVEPYLEKCIKSIQEQTYKNIEIILVDDGSTDNCGKICDKYLMLDDRIRVIHKKNGGLSDARNAGIEISKGEYICFVDSDDYIEKDYCEVLYKALMETKSDISSMNYEEVFPQKMNIINAIESTKKVFDNKLNIYEGLDIQKELLYRKTFKNYAWNKLYKAELAKKHLFRLKKNYEDILHTFELLQDINRISYINKKGYNYVRRNKSICYKPSEKNLNDFIDVTLWRFEIVEQKYPQIENYNYYAVLEVIISSSIKYLNASFKYESFEEKLDYLSKKLISYVQKNENKFLELLNDFEKTCLYLICYNRTLFYSFLKEREKLIENSIFN